MSHTPATLPSGVFAASVTPLKKDHTIDLDKLVDHCHWLLQNGNDGICFMGTTGEANSFSIEERESALNYIIKKGIPPYRLMVGTGCCAITDTIRLTRHAVGQKVGGVLILPPFYYKGVTDEGLFQYFSALIKKENDPDLKIYLYHFPKMTGVPFSTALVKRLVEAFPGVIVGMKDSSGDWNNMKTVLETIPGFKLYSGTEKYFLDVLRLGGAGCISATTNLTGKIAAKVAAQNDAAQADEWQAKLTAARLAFEGVSFIAGVKHVLAQWQGDSEWLNIRPPNTALTTEQVTELEGRLKSIDFHP